jgi:SAM-dependent methyltransferase
MLIREFSVNAWGIDPDMALLRSHGPIPAVQAVAQTLPFRSCSFKALFCECVLSLTPDMDRTLVEFYRVLEPGGTLVLCDIHLRKKRYSEALKQIPLACGFRQAVERENMEDRVAAAGFNNLEWEDLSFLLTRLAGEIIFEHGTLLNFWNKIFGGPCRSAHHTCETIRASRPGYFRLLARKGSPKKLTKNRQRTDKEQEKR